MGESRPEAGPVEGDPFWSVVRRRHPDVDIVLLPPQAEPDATSSGLPALTLTDDDVARLDARPAALWRELVGPEPAEPGARWIAGDTRDAVRREVTLAVEGIDPVAGTGLVLDAVAALRAEGWRVLAPPTGMPRVLASREATDGLAGREEVQLVLVPGSGRLVLRHRSAGVPVGRSAARALLTGERP